MLEDIQYFIEDHLKLVIAGVIVLVLIIVMFGIRSHNLSKKAQEEANQGQQQEQVAQQPTELQEEGLNQDTKSEYTANLSIYAEKDNKVQIEEEDGKINEKQKILQTEPSFDTDFSIFDHTNVPDKMVDGSSVKDYLIGVTMSDFGSEWGSQLQSDDFYTKKRYLVGVEQDVNNYIKGDLQSVGWLINNFGVPEKF